MDADGDHDGLNRFDGASTLFQVFGTLFQVEDE